jgi:predicted kinase
MTTIGTVPGRVLIITGPPGAGETTTARILAEASERAVHLESDFFFHCIRAGYIEPWKPESHEQNTAIMQIVAAAAAGYANAGYFTIVDGIIAPRWFFRPLRDALRTVGLTVAYAVLRAPLAVCAARAASRDASRLTDHAVLEHLWNEFVDLDELEPHAIDIEDNDPGAVAETLAQRLRDSSLDVTSH